jgi:hypothetical protein
MLLILLLWVLIFFVFFTLGFTVVTIINRFTRPEKNAETLKADELFFTGFLSVSILTGFLSIFLPVNNYLLIVFTLLALLLFLIWFRKIQIILQETVNRLASLSKPELIAISLFIIFVLTAVAQKITLGDTESYHAQSIQWIRKYAVVPGLGNIHGRLAFNSMFFVISGLFTFQIKDILIFPVNGIAYIVLVIKLLILYKKENVPGSGWKEVFYIMIILISFLVFIPNLNSPSPDIICAILIIYAFTMVMNIAEEWGQTNSVRIILLNLLVFSCITFKISSVFLVLLLIFLINKDILKRSIISIVIGILVITPFIIRNYYLSGYVIYPFPSLDIFNTDWKIPVNDVIAMKTEIAGFAKVSTISAFDVGKMRFSEWLLPWFKLLDSVSKILVVMNLFSVITVILMLFKKEYFLVRIQLIILLNLLFWFIMAPDPRFAYGFIFLGFSLNVSFIVKLLDYQSNPGVMKYIKAGIVCLLIVVVFKRINFPAETIKNPSSLVISAPFGTVPTNDYSAEFKYKVPVPGGGCFNVEIPCVPYPLTNIVLRGKDLQDGFKIVKQSP